MRIRKVMGHIYSYTHADAPSEQQMIGEIAQTLFPGGIQTENDRRDVEIVFNSHKYGTILVTADGAILNEAQVLAERFRIRIMSDEEAVAFVRSRIQARDDRVRQLAADSGARVPEWVGKD